MKRLEEAEAQKKREEEEEEAERKRRAAQPLLKETAFDRRKVCMGVVGSNPVRGTDKALVLDWTSSCSFTPSSRMQYVG